MGAGRIGDSSPSYGGGLTLTRRVRTAFFKGTDLEIVNNRLTEWLETHRLEKDEFLDIRYDIQNGRVMAVLLYFG